MTTLHLVRHGRPAPDSGPASAWPLHQDAEDGFADLRGSGALPARARWFSSPEPKAFGTARALTSTAVGLVDGLREMSRPAEGWRGDDEWSEIVQRSMSDPDTPARPGWETATATTDRVLAAVRRIHDSCPDDDLVLVGHGTAWTLLVAALTRGAPDLGAWARLRMPDHCTLAWIPNRSGAGAARAAGDSATGGATSATGATSASTATGVAEATVVADWGAWTSG